jgi:serine/threonine protein kinase
MGNTDYAWSLIETEFHAIQNLFSRGTSKYLVEVFGIGRLPTNFFFIDMELCGQSLHNYIWGERAFAQTGVDKSRAQIMWEIASGVEFIHGCNAVHRDLKPLNSKFPC